MTRIVQIVRGPSSRIVQIFRGIGATGTPGVGLSPSPPQTLFGNASNATAEPIPLSVPQAKAMLGYRDASDVNTAIAAALVAQIVQWSQIEPGTLPVNRLPTNVVRNDLSYSNPAWITALAASKITGELLPANIPTVYARRDQSNTFSQVQHIGVATSSEPFARLNVAASDAISNVINIENTGAGQASLIIQRTGATPSRWVQYIPSGSTALHYYHGISDRFTFSANGNFTAAGNVTASGTASLFGGTIQLLSQNAGPILKGVFAGGLQVRNWVDSAFAPIEASNLTVFGGDVYRNANIGTATGGMIDFGLLSQPIIGIQALSNVQNFQALPIQPNGGNVLIGTSTDNASGARLQVAGAATFSGNVTSTFQSLSLNPTTFDLTSGQCRIVKNTTLNELQLWANDGGTMRTIGGGGAGTIGGSTGATDNRILRSDGSGGATLQNSPLTIDDSGNVTGVGSITVAQGTITADAPILNGTSTWNNAGVTFCADRINVTDTASNAASLLIDRQVGGVSFFRVTKVGHATARSFTTTTGTDIDFNRSGIQLSGLSSGIWFGGGAAAGILTEGNLNTLAQRNGTNAQTFRLYNTFTDPSNFERGFMRWSSNVLEIGAEAGGTGANRNLLLRTAAGTVTLSAVGTSAHLSLGGVRSSVRGNLSFCTDAGNGFSLYNEHWEPTSSAGLNSRDNLADCGTAASRFRDGHFGRNVFVGGNLTSTFQTLSANPSTMDLSAGQCRVVKNTTNNEVRLWTNDGGTMKSVLLN